jgi:adenosine/AMP kinase
MEITAVRLDIPAEANLVAGQSHFIKTVEDLAEIVVTTVPGARFGLAFCEASGPCLVRTEGNDPELMAAAVANAERVAAGHTFWLLLRGAYPINLLNAVKACPEVCRVFCATANPVEALVVRTAQGGGVVGVVDGSPPRGVEDEAAQQERRAFLRRIGYKRG